MGSNWNKRDKGTDKVGDASGRPNFDADADCVKIPEKKSHFKPPSNAITKREQRSIQTSLTGLTSKGTDRKRTFKESNDDGGADGLNSSWWFDSLSDTELLSFDQFDKS